jgi:glycosyltransferase involved in cell wall biosynthesis
MSKKKFHICLNLIADPNWHGGSIYIHNIVHAVDKLTADERKKIKLTIATRDVSFIPDEIKYKIDGVYKETLLHLAFYKIIRNLPSFFRFKWLNYRQIDFYYPAGNLPRKWIFNWGGWIPDFQYRHLPHLFSVSECNSREMRNAHLAKHSPVLAFSSAHAMNDYITFFPEYKGNEYLLHFVSNANKQWLSQNADQVMQKYKLPEKYFIVCNQFWKHKDHETVIDALFLLKQRGITAYAVCTGATEDFRNPDYYPSLLKRATEKGVSEEFIVLGFISRQDQIQLIRKSMAIIQPSLFEGWSTVVEDGRSLGKTIFLSDFPVHIEQNPPYTYYFSQQNAQQLAELIELHWPSLHPGPDLDKEQQAFVQNENMMQEFARNVIAMAKSVSKRRNNF